jgi:hypothetical protein
MFVFLAACTIQFLPEVDENREVLVVEGMITDQNRVNTIKISRSMPIGKPMQRKPVRGLNVSIVDQTGALTILQEKTPGNYMTDSTKFRGQVGKKYSLRIRSGVVIYSTPFIEMKPVPPIEKLYWEKVTITESSDPGLREEGCKIYLDTNDPEKKCQYYRWEYVETWEYRVPYDVVKKVCWVTQRSDLILIKNTSILSQARITKLPVIFITNNSDRLKERYSLQVKQYSLNPEEFDFWEKIQNVSQNVGGLYDITPMAISSNIKNESNPSETVLGYFSVSAVTEKRIFVKDLFMGLPNFYSYCATDTVYGKLPETGLNYEYWVIEDNGNELPPWWVVTTYRECADCTTKGTTVRPDFWLEYLLQE